MTKNLGKVFHLAVNFLLAGLSFNACANMARKYLRDQGY